MPGPQGSIPVRRVLATTAAMLAVAVSAAG
jgi:hypothetical protein